MAKTTTHSSVVLHHLNIMNHLIQSNTGDKDMKSSYVSLHRTLDTTIQNLESQINPNQSFITDLKKKKLQLKEHIDMGKPLPRGAHSKLASMLHSHKVNEKMKRKQRKIAKHAYDEELKRRLQNLSS